MRLKEIYRLADQIAPFALSGEWCGKYGAYDNSGVQLDCGGEIERVFFSLELSSETAERAKEYGAQLVVTHHPAIYSPLHSLAEAGEGKEILFCARNGISVLSAHLNLDCAPGGIDDSLMYGLGGEKADAVMLEMTGGGYGKVFDVAEQPLSDYVDAAKRTFRTGRVLVYGEKPVKRVACFCGGGMDEESIAFALKNGADTYVSSDPKHHLITMAREGANVILLTHYAAETYGFYRFYQKLKEKSGLESQFFADERFL